MKKAAAFAAALKYLSSAALGTVLGILLDGGDLAVGLRHESLQLLLEELVSGLGSGGGHGVGTLRTVLALMLAALTGRAGMIAAVVALAEVTAAEIAALTGRVFAGLAGLQTLDGQIDLAVIGADDHDLHILTFGQMLANVADIGIGNLRNMYQTCLILRQRNKCAKIGDRLYLAI